MTLILLTIPNYSFASQNNKQVQKTCMVLKSKYSIATLDLWRSGNASDKELIKELDNNIMIIQNEIKKNKGSFKNNLIKLEKSQNYLKKSINDENIQNVINALSDSINSFNKIKKHCLG